MSFSSTPLSSHSNVTGNSNSSAPTEVTPTPSAAAKEKASVVAKETINKMQDVQPTSKEKASVATSAKTPADAKEKASAVAKEQISKQLGTEGQTKTASFESQTKTMAMSQASQSPSALLQLTEKIRCIAHALVEIDPSLQLLDGFLTYAQEALPLPPDYEVYSNLLKDNSQFIECLLKLKDCDLFKLPPKIQAALLIPVVSNSIKSLDLKDCHHIENLKIFCETFSHLKKLSMANYSSLEPLSILAELEELNLEEICWGAKLDVLPNLKAFSFVPVYPALDQVLEQIKIKFTALKTLSVRIPHFPSRVQLPKIKTLIFEGRGIQGSTISENFPSVKHLILRNADSFRSPHTLAHLKSLKINQPVGLLELEEILNANPQLRAIDIAYRSESPNAVTKLFEMLSSLKGLTALHLKIMWFGNNEFFNEKNISQLLGNHPNLAELTIDLNGASLAKVQALPKLKGIQKIRFIYDPRCDEEVKKLLMQHLPHCTFVSKGQENPFTHEKANAFFQQFWQGKENPLTQVLSRNEGLVNELIRRHCRHHQFEFLPQFMKEALIQAGATIRTLKLPGNVSEIQDIQVLSQCSPQIHHLEIFVKAKEAIEGISKFWKELRTLKLEKHEYSNYAGGLDMTSLQALEHLHTVAIQGDLDAKELASLAMVKPDLRSLTLLNSYIYFDLFAAATLFSNLEVLDLCQKRISRHLPFDDIIIVIGNQFTKLKELALPCCNTPLTQETAKQLASLQGLVSLNANLESSKTIASFLATQHPLLTELRLSTKRDPDFIATLSGLPKLTKLFIALSNADQCILQLVKSCAGLVELQITLENYLSVADLQPLLNLKFLKHLTCPKIKIGGQNEKAQLQQLLKTFEAKGCKVTFV